MVEVLRRHYVADGKPADEVFAAEIRAADSIWRADLIWAPVVLSAGEGVVASEVRYGAQATLAAVDRLAGGVACHCERLAHLEGLANG